MKKMLQAVILSLTVLGAWDAPAPAAEPVPAFRLDGGCAKASPNMSLALPAPVEKLDPPFISCQQACHDEYTLCGDGTTFCCGGLSPCPQAIDCQQQRRECDRCCDMWNVPCAIC